MTNAAIIASIESLAPTTLQESWDNTGLQVGSLRADCSGVLLCVDVTPDIVDEAASRGCNLIISHHPLIFKGLKRLTGNTPVEESVMRAVANGITVYSSHTAVDNAPGGVSYTMAKLLGADVVRTLSPSKDRLVKVCAVVAADALPVALTSFEEAAPSCRTFVSETKSSTIHVADDAFATSDFDFEKCCNIESIVDASLAASLHMMLDETLGDSLKSFQTIATSDVDPAVGLGVYALFDRGITAKELISKVKSAFNSPIVRCTTPPDDDILIRRVAMCGGSGGEFISRAIAAGAQAYITSDTRYHDFVDFQNHIFIIDIGHFESESCTKDIFYNAIKEKFPNFACYYSNIEKNPVNYL